MPDLTQLGDSDIRELAGLFALGTVRAWRRVEAGTINTNYRVETDRGLFFLRVNEGKREEDVAYEAGLVEALAEAGVPTPRPHETREGAPFAVYQSRYISVFPWIPGGHRLGAEIRPNHAAEVGAALAALHLAGLQIAPRFERAGIYTFEDIVGRFEGFRDHRDPALAGAIEAIEEEIGWLRERSALRRAARRGVIHGDLFADNVLFDDDDKLTALLDFEQASTGSLVYDLAVCLNAWCFGDGIERERVRALVGAYHRRRALAGDEVAGLYVEVRAAAMRFTVTRITDVYLPGVSLPGKDFRRYLARLRAWRDLGEPRLLALAGLAPHGH